MSATEGNKELVRRWIEEVWNLGQLERTAEFMAADIVDHKRAPGQGPGIEGAVQALAMFRTAFPDVRFVLEDLITEGDKVVLRTTAYGTHLGALMGMPATGRQVVVPAIGIVRIAGGKIVERWRITDDLGMLQQLGAIPPAEQHTA